LDVAFLDNNNNNNDNNLIDLRGVKREGLDWIGLAEDVI
jgi:hypothetical protein